MVRGEITPYLSEIAHFTTSNADTGIVVESIQTLDSFAAPGSGFEDGWVFKFDYHRQRSG
jgi:hypothetical protein